jgi:hypothetical protein
MSLFGPTLPSAVSAGHGSYLRISCRHWGRRTTAEDDPIPTSSGVNRLTWTIGFRAAPRRANAPSERSISGP